MSGSWEHPAGIRQEGGIASTGTLAGVFLERVEVGQGQAPLTVATLVNAAGSRMRVLDLGAIVWSLEVPDHTGRLGDVVLGLPHPANYLDFHPYFGAIVGRLAGRIPGGRLPLPGLTCFLPCPDGRAHLHGGPEGLHQRRWRLRELPAPESGRGVSIELTYSSPHGECGYPGNVDLRVIYTLDDDNTLGVETEVWSDRATAVNLSHHSYFNLAAERADSVADHLLSVTARETFLTDAHLLPLGVIAPVSPLNDLRQPRRLGELARACHLHHGDLYRLREDMGGEISEVACLQDPLTGRRLTVWTNESAVQLYLAHSFDGSIVGKGGRRYGPLCGVCLECESYPDAAAHPELGSVLVWPGHPRRRRTEYRFTVASDDSSQGS